jgi:hypothetical protein
MRSYCIESLRSDGINCVENLDGILKVFGSIFAFHSFEYFSDSIEMLKDMKKSLVLGGVLKKLHTSILCTNTLPI